MSDPSTPTEDPQQGPAQLREFAERQKADAEAARSEAETLRAQNRALTFQAAGVDLESPTGKLLDKAYDGDLTVDAVRAAWSEVAPQGTPAPAAETPPEPVDDGPSADEQAAVKARAALAGGGTPPGEEPTGPVWEGAIAGFRDEAAKGVPLETRQRHALDKVFTAAAEGDETAIFDENAWKAQFR